MPPAIQRISGLWPLRRALSPARGTALCACALVCCAAQLARAQAPPTEPKSDVDAARDFDELEAAVSTDGAGGDPSASEDRSRSGTNSAPAARTDQSASGEAGSARGAMNPDLSLIADFAAAYFSADDHLQTGGHDPSETGFNLQQLELSAGASVDPYFRFDANIVFSLFGVEIEEAYGTTLDLPGGLQARFGQFLTRFGRLNATHPHAWAFVDQPFALGRVFGGEGNRGLGVELSWLTPLPWYVELVGSVTQADGEGTARSFFGADDLGVESPADLLYVTALKQFFPLAHDWSLAWGFSGAFGPNSTGRENRTAVYGTDVYLKFRPITRGASTHVALQSEWLYRRRQVPDEVLQDVNGYAQLVWRFDARWGTAARWDYGSPAFDTGGNRFDADPLDPEWNDSRHRASLNVTFWPTEFSRFRLQGSRDMPGWRDGIWAAFLAAELVTGAHGSHAF
jgi:hypothetical protein